MEEYLIENIKPFSGLDSDSVYLILFHADKQPPHLGMISGNQYFSLRYDKLQLAVEPKPILKTVNQKKIPCLIFEVEKTKENIFDVFQAYESIDSISCLFPIREYFYPQNHQDIELIFDLLDKLKRDQKIIATYSLNLKVDSGLYAMKRYSSEDVQNEIKRLQK